MFNEISYLSDEICGRFIGFAEGESTFAIKYNQKKKLYSCHFVIQYEN